MYDNRGGYSQNANNEDGPDTVRILPDGGAQKANRGGSGNAGHAGNVTDVDEGEWMIERPVVRSGTLYTRVPAETMQPQQQTQASADVTQYQQSQAIVSRQEQAIEAQGGVAPQQVTNIHKGPSACAIMAITFSLLLLSCAALFFFAIGKGWDGLGKLGGFFSFPNLGMTQTVTIDTSQPTVIDKIQALSRLETVHYELEKVVSGKSSGPLPDFLTSDKILLVAHGEVIAGVDLSQVMTSDIKVVSGTVTIRLPDSEIFVSTLDNDKTYVYDRQTGIFNKPDPNLETDIRRVAEQEITKTAMEDGILEKAKENAKGVLRALILGLGYKEVEFVP